jgi:hypothetical protein
VRVNTLSATDLRIVHDWRPAMITRLIREASSEQEIYLLLAAYVEATQLHAKVSNRSGHGANTPASGLDVIKKWMLDLFAELSAASTGLDGSSRVAVKEGLYVFGEALVRLETLDSTSGTQPVNTSFNLEEGYAVRPPFDAFTPLARTAPSIGPSTR